MVFPSSSETVLTLVLVLVEITLDALLGLKVADGPFPWLRR
jgi:hypothetical protein